MKDINWGTVIAILVGIAVLFAVWTMFTKKHVDTETGKIVTKFSGFEGEA